MEEKAAGGTESYVDRSIDFILADLCRIANSAGVVKKVIFWFHNKTTTQVVGSTCRDIYTYFGKDFVRFKVRINYKKGFFNNLKR